MLERFHRWIESIRAVTVRHMLAVLEKLRRFASYVKTAKRALTAAGWEKLSRFVEYIKTAIEWTVIALAVPAVFFGIWEGYFGNCVFDECIIAKEEEITLAEWLTIIASATGLILLYRRTRNQDRQIQLQTDKEIDDRFTAAVTLLGSSETSARTGAVYSLYQLAVENGKYRNQVAQILCSHIRSKTQEKNYQKNHVERPSNEIQTTIDLLFRYENELEGIYHKGFSGMSFPNLSHAYLVGADFREAQCRLADFSEARCQHAFFSGAKCQDAFFSGAQCHGAFFSYAQLQGAFFSRAKCQDAYFSEAICWDAYFVRVQCQRADFEEALCQGASFRSAQCQGAKFLNTQFQGADLEKLQCQGANFSETSIEGAHSSGEDLTLSDRIGQPAEVGGVIFSGELDKRTIKAIENARAFLSNSWYQEMQQIINDNKGKSVNAGVDTSSAGLDQLGIITGILEDSEEIRQIIRDIEGD